MVSKKEDTVRDELRKKLGLDNPSTKESGVGQLYSFADLGFTNYDVENVSPDIKNALLKKPDGWYFDPDNSFALVAETKSSEHTNLEDDALDQITVYEEIAKTKYEHVIGIIYNGYDTYVYKNEVLFNNPGMTDNDVKNIQYYKSLFKSDPVDKQFIYDATTAINDNLHFKFMVNSYTDRMSYTACLLVAQNFGANLNIGDTIQNVKSKVLEALDHQLTNEIKRNAKLNILIHKFKNIDLKESYDRKLKADVNQNAFNEIIDNVRKIASHLDSNK